MSYTISLPADLGKELERRRVEAGHSISSLARLAGKTRPVVYRLERGDESSVSSLLAVVAALGLTVRLEKAELPTLEDMEHFFEDDDDGLPA